MLNEQDVFGGSVPLDKLMDELNTLFPAFLPTPASSMELIMFRSGQRSVVEYLRDHYAKKDV